MKHTILPLCGGLLFLLTAGCGDGEQDKKSLAERSGEKFGRSAREFTVAVGKGVENSRVKMLTVAPELQERGLEFTVSKEQDVLSAEQSKLLLYVIAEKEFDGQVQVRAMNAQNQEIGRSRETLSLEPDEAKYINVSFPKEMDASSVESYDIRAAKESK